MYKCGSKHHIENKTAGSRKEKNGSNTGDSKIGLEHRKIWECKWKVVAESYKQHAWMKDSCRHIKCLVSNKSFLYRYIFQYVNLII